MLIIVIIILLVILLSKKEKKEPKITEVDTLLVDIRETADAVPINPYCGKKQWTGPNEYGLWPFYYRKNDYYNNAFGFSSINQMHTDPTKFTYGGRSYDVLPW